MEPIMGLSASTLDWMNDQLNAQGDFPGNAGTMSRDDAVQESSTSSVRLDLDANETHCSASQFIRIIFSDTMLNEKTKGLRTHVRSSPRRQKEAAGISDIEWRSPYAKARYKDVLALESAGDLPFVSRYYADTLRRLAMSSQDKVWSTHKQRTLMFLSLQQSLRHVREAHVGDNRHSKQHDKPHKHFLPMSASTDERKHATSVAKCSYGAHPQRKKVSKWSFCFNALAEFTSIQLVKMVKEDPSSACSYLEYLVAQVEQLEEEACTTREDCDGMFGRLHSTLHRVTKEVLLVLSEETIRSTAVVTYLKLLSTTATALVGMAVKTKRLSGILEAVCVLMECEEVLARVITPPLTETASLDIRFLQGTLQQLEHHCQHAYLGSPTNGPHGSGIMFSIQIHEETPYCTPTYPLTQSAPRSSQASSDAAIQEATSLRDMIASAFEQRHMHMLVSSQLGDPEESRSPSSPAPIHHTTPYDDLINMRRSSLQQETVSEEREAPLLMPPGIVRYPGRSGNSPRAHKVTLTVPGVLYLHHSFTVHFEYSSTYINDDADWIGLYPVESHEHKASAEDTRDQTSDPLGNEDTAVETTTPRDRRPPSLDISTIASNAFQPVRLGGRSSRGSAQTPIATVGDRFYLATAERRKHGIVWEAECGPPSCGAYEFRYYRGSGTGNLIATSKPVCAIERFCSLTSSETALFLQYENGFRRYDLDLADAALCGKTSELKQPESHPGSVQFGMSWLAYCGDRLFVRSPKIKGAMAILDPVTFEMKSTVSIVGGGVPESVQETERNIPLPVVSKESDVCRSPMCSDGRYLYFMRLEETTVDGENLMDSWPEDNSSGMEDSFYSDDDGIDDHTLLQEERDKCRHRQQSPRSSHKFRVVIDVIDPSRPSFPLVKHVTLSFGHHLVGHRKNKCAWARLSHDERSNESLESVKRELGIGVDTETSAKSNAGYSVHPDRHAYVDVSYENVCEEPGIVSSWTLNCTSRGTVTVAIWHRVSKSQFLLRGSNTFDVEAGYQTVHIPAERRVHVEVGDCIGALDSALIHCVSHGSNARDVSMETNGSVYLTLSQDGCHKPLDVVRFNPSMKQATYALLAHIVPSEDELHREHQDGYDQDALFLSKFVVQRLGPNNFSMYSNGDYLSFILKHQENNVHHFDSDLSLEECKGDNSLGDPKLYETRCRTFLLQTGYLAADIALRSNGDSARANHLATCYDSFNGCLWAARIGDHHDPVSSIDKFAASSIPPAWSVKKNNAYANDKFLHQESASFQELAAWMLHQINRIATAYSPANLHTKTCLDAATALFSRAQEDGLANGPTAKAASSSDHALRACLKRGTNVNARYGPGWFAGEISRVNEDGTYVVLYADGDIRTNVPADNIKITLPDGSEILATKWRPWYFQNSARVKYARSAWTLPQDDTFAPFGLEANLVAFSALYQTLSTSFRRYCKAFVKGSLETSTFLQPALERHAAILVGALDILDMNVQLLLTKDIDIAGFDITVVNSQTNDGVLIKKPLLEAFKDLLQAIVSAKATSEVLALQESANRSLTLGLDLWFRDTTQQLELLNAILQDKERLFSGKTSNSYALLLVQFARRGTISKIVSCGLEEGNLEGTKRLFLETLQNLMDINENCALLHIKHIAAGVFTGENVQTDKCTTLQDYQPVLDLLVSFHLECLSIVAENPVGKFSKNAAAMYSSLSGQAISAFAAMERILRSVAECITQMKQHSILEPDKAAQQTAAVGRLLTVVESSIVGKLLPLHTTILSSLLCADTLSSEIGCGKLYRGHADTKLSASSGIAGVFKANHIDLYHRDWIETILNFTRSSMQQMQAILFDIQQLGWDSKGNLTSDATKRPQEGQLLSSFYKNLVFFSGLLAGSLLRITPPLTGSQKVDHSQRKSAEQAVSDMTVPSADSMQQEQQQFRVYTLSQWWLASPLFSGGIIRVGTGEYSEMSEKKRRHFLDTVVQATGSLREPTRNLAVAAISPDRKRQLDRNGRAFASPSALSPPRSDQGLSDGSASLHIQEIARQTSHITRRRLAIDVAIVNEAERAVAAALIHHCGLVTETESYAHAFNTMSSSDGSDGDDGVNTEELALPTPPEILVKLWKNARRARKWLKEQKDKRQGNVKVYGELAATVIDRATFLLDIAPYSNASTGWHFDGVCEEILKFVTVPNEDVSIDILRTTLSSYPGMIDARINGLKALRALIVEVKYDPKVLLELLVPLSKIVTEIPHIMSCGISKKPLHKEYELTLTVLGDVINEYCVNIAEKREHTVTRENCARTLLSIFYIASTLYRQVDVGSLLNSNINESISKCVTTFASFEKGECLQYQLFGNGMTAKSSLLCSDSISSMINKMPEIELTPYVEVSSINSTHSRDPTVLFNDSGYWQSEGNLPHWLQFSVPHGVLIKCMRVMFIDQDIDKDNGGQTLGNRIDHSYCPRVLSVFIGKSKRHMQKIRSLDIGISHDWVELFSAVDLAQHPDCVTGEVSVIRLEIAHNHMSGQNSRISKVKIMCAVPGGDTDFSHFILPAMSLFSQFARRITISHIIKEFDYLQKGSSTECKAIKCVCGEQGHESRVNETDQNSSNPSLPTPATVILQTLLPILPSKVPATVALKYLSNPLTLSETIVRLWEHEGNVSVACARLLRKGLVLKPPSYWNNILSSEGKDVEIDEEDVELFPTIRKRASFVVLLIEKMASARNRHSGSRRDEAATSESISILRGLCDTSTVWAEEVYDEILKVLQSTTAVLENKLAPFTEILLALNKLSSIMLVLGGHTEILRTGGYVEKTETGDMLKFATDSFPKFQKQANQKYLVVEVLEKHSADSMAVESLAKRVTTNDGIVRIKLGRVSSSGLKHQKFMSNDEFKMPQVVSLPQSSVLPVPELPVPETLCKLWGNKSVQALLSLLLHATQPFAFTKFGSCSWQETRMYALKAMATPQALPQITKLMSRNGSIMSSMMHVVKHPVAKLAKLSEQTEGIAKMEQQAKLLKRLCTSPNGTSGCNTVIISIRPSPSVTNSGELSSSPTSYRLETKIDTTDADVVLLMEDEDDDDTKGGRTAVDAGIISSPWFVEISYRGEQYALTAKLIYTNENPITVPSASMVRGELITFSDLYTSSTMDYGKRSILVAQENELSELSTFSELKNMAALVVISNTERDITINDLTSHTVDCIGLLPSLCLSIRSDDCEFLTSKPFVEECDMTDLKAWRDSVCVGDEVDAIFWPTNSWAKATVIDMGHRYTPAPRFLRITYHGIPSRFDRWVCRFSGRLAPLGSKCHSLRHSELTVQGDEVVAHWRKSLNKGVIIDAKDTMGNWYKSIVIDLKGDDIKIHYQGWKPRWDIWLSKYSSDISPLCTLTRPWRNFMVGDVVDSNPRTRDDHTAWTEGRVVNVEHAETTNEQKLLGALGTVTRVCIEFTKMIGEPRKWFKTNAEELCVPGTHVTTKRKDQYNKPILPRSVQKFHLPQHTKDIMLLQQLGHTQRLICHEALQENQNDITSALYWLFRNPRGKSQGANPHLEKPGPATGVRSHMHAASMAFRGIHRTTGAPGEHICISAGDIKGPVPADNVSLSICFWLKLLSDPNATVSTGAGAVLQGATSSMDDHVSVLLRGTKLQKPLAVGMHIRVLNFSKWVAGEINKVNLDGTFSVMLKDDGTIISAVPRAHVHYTIEDGNPFQATMDKRRRLCVSLSTVDPESKGCIMHRARSSGSVGVGIWTHIALVVNASGANEDEDDEAVGTMTLYIDGVNDAEIAFSGGLVPALDPLNICGSIRESGPAAFVKDVQIRHHDALDVFNVINSMRAYESFTSNDTKESIRGMMDDPEVSRDDDGCEYGSKMSDERNEGGDDVGSKDNEHGLDRDHPGAGGNRSASPLFCDERQGPVASGAVLDFGTKDTGNVDEEANREIATGLSLRLGIAQRVAEQHAQVVDINSLANRGKLRTYTEAPLPLDRAAVFSMTQLEMLRKGANVQGRVGSRWYPGKIHSINADGSIDVCFDDNDFRPSVPAERIRVLVGDGKSWLLASDMLKHSVPEMQEKRVLERKSAVKLKHLQSSMYVLLQTLYAEHLMLKVISFSKKTTKQALVFPLLMTTPTHGASILLTQYLRVASERPLSLFSKAEHLRESEWYENRDILYSSILGSETDNARATGTALDLFRDKVLASLQHEHAHHTGGLPTIFLALVSECFGMFVRLCHENSVPRSKKFKTREMCTSNNRDEVFALWILDLLVEFLEATVVDDSEAYMDCVRELLFSETVCPLIIKVTHYTSKTYIVTMISLLTRYLRLMPRFINNTSFMDINLFSTLSRVFAQRYQKEQLTMTKAQAGGVPVYSTYCQVLAELMVQVKQVSHILRKDSHNGFSLPKGAAGPSVRALNRRMQWGGLDLGEALGPCEELLELDHVVAVLRDPKKGDLHETSLALISTYGKSIDCELTRLVNKSACNKKISPLKVRMDDAINTWKDETNGGLNSAKYPSLSSLLMDERMCRDALIAMQSRLELLRKFNRLLQINLPLIDLRVGLSFHGLGARVSAQRHFIFLDVKRTYLSRLMKCTMATHGDERYNPDSVIGLKLNRWVSSSGRGMTTKLSHTIFGQMFLQLADAGSVQLRTKQRPFQVTFEGEAGEDAGGPFRSSLMFMCDDLMSGRSPLLLRTLADNGNFTLHDGSCLQQAPYFEFVGKMLGVGLRYDTHCPLNMCSLFWKYMTGCLSDIGLDDIEQLDSAFASFLTTVKGMSETEQEGLCDSLTWTVRTSSGAVVPLWSEAGSSEVSVKDIPNYLARAFAVRVNESASAAACVFRGLASVVPASTFQLFTWQELRDEVAGKEKLDIELLKRNTIFEFGDAQFQGTFWRVLSEMSREHQQQLLRFWSGRDRLPLGDEGMEKFRIVEMRRRGDMDKCLPEAATCSFTLTLPRYSSIGIMLNRLLVAIENCTAYDLDGAAAGVVLTEDMQISASDASDTDQSDTEEG